MGPGSPSLDAELGLAVSVATEAAAWGRQAQRRQLSVQGKSGPADLVSEDDLALDAQIVGRLLRQFPDDGSPSEEGGRVSGAIGRTWVVDPIDGTHNYLAGLSHYAITIALLDGQETVPGVVYDATDQTLYSATAASRVPEPPGEPVRLEVASALIAVSLPVHSIFCETGLRPPLDQAGDIRITGSLALDLVWTALGRFDACVYRHRGNPWDWAASELIALSRGRQMLRSAWDDIEVLAVGPPDVTAALSRVS
jgi:myo-inositol-1(or 4)-monophosphatase